MREALEACGVREASMCGKPHKDLVLDVQTNSTVSGVPVGRWENNRLKFSPDTCHLPCTMFFSSSPNEDALIQGTKVIGGKSNLIYMGHIW